MLESIQLHLLVTILLTSHILLSQERLLRLQITPPPSTGYSFSRWATSSGDTVNFPYKVTSDVIFYAQFNYIGTTITQSGSINTSMIVDKTYGVQGGGTIIPMNDGHIPNLAITFPKAFVDIPSVSNSVSYNITPFGSPPYTLSITSISTTGFNTGASASSSIVRILGSPGNLIITINWTATGRA